MTDRDETRRWMGAFALEGDDADMASGELAYHQREGISVQTLSFVDEDASFRRDATRTYAALKGVVEGARRCTIFHAFDTSVAGGRLEHRRIIGNAILIDGLCNDPALPAYRGMRFSSPALTAIVNPRGIEVGIAARTKSVKVVARPRKATTTKWGDHKLKMSATLNAAGGQAWDGSYSMSEKPYLELQFAFPVSVDDILRYTAALEFLTCVGDGSFSGPPEVSIWSEPVRSKRNRGSLPSVPAQLLLSQSWYKKAETKHPFRRPILLDALSPLPLDVIASWLDLAPKVERLMALFRAATEAPNVETRFLFFVQAVEGLHRTLDDHVAIDGGEFNRGVDALRSAIPAELSKGARQYFDKRIPQRNELSLAGRLKDYGGHVTRLHPDALPSFGKDRRGIVELRNAFSHALTGDETTDLEASGRTLLYYSEVLRLLFEFNILRHLEIGDQALRDAFARTVAFEKLARDRKELLGEGGRGKSDAGKATRGDRHATSRSQRSQRG